jgi:hypothetical protein
VIRSSNTLTGTRFCQIIVLLLSICTAAAATSLSGTFKNPDGSFVNGKIIFLLSQPARLNDQSAQIVPMVKIFAVTNGALEGGAFVYGNDVLVPGGTYYLVRLVDSNNNLLFEQKWSISGVSLNLGTLTPTTTGVVYPDPLIKNLATSQAVQGPVSFSAPITAFSLTLNGNLNPGAADLYDLGNSSAPWQELHAQRWNSLFAVGSSGGTALPPTGIPGAAVLSSGGSIGAGTYYFKVTYFNKNGETTASPARTVTVASGTTNRIHVAPNDALWGSGCYGYLVYASTDNVNFYAQTPSGVSADFQLSAPGGKTGHYVALGSYGARFNSLTLSGVAPPSTNTATIDPLQVALNNTMRQSDYGASQGTLIVPVAFSGGAISAHTLTTPLVVPRYAHIKGVSHYGVGKTDAGASRIYGAWADSKLGVVMTFGGFHSIENVTIFGPGHGVIYLAGVGLQAEAEIAKNAAFRTSDTSNTYAALKIVGVHYNVHHENVYLRGGKAAVQGQNLAGGGNWTFKDVRWDLGGSSAIQNISSLTDPDNGVNDGGFSNATGPVTLRDILIEQGTGILLDCMNMGVRLSKVEMADTTAQAGTDSFIKTGCDANCTGQNALSWEIEDSSLPASGNVRVGTNISTGGVPNFTVIRSSLGAGSSTGTFVGLDLNNINTPIWLFAANIDPNPNATGTNVAKIINTASTAQIFSFVTPMLPNQSISLYGWNEFPDRVVITPAGSNGSNRSARQSWFNSGGPIELRGVNDTQQNAIFDTNGNLTLRQNLTINPNGVSASRIALGQTPAAGGSISVVNQGSVYMRNVANTADVRLIAGDASDRAIVGDANGVCLSTSSNCAPIKGNLSAAATLDFPSTSASACSDLTLAVTGATAGDPVFLGAPNVSIPIGGSFFAWVSATNTVTVRFCADGTARDPASGSFRVTIVKF